MSFFLPRSAEIFHFFGMTRIKNFEIPLSQRHDRRQKLAQEGPKRRPRTKSEPNPTAKSKRIAQQKYLRRLGRGGRAERQAVQYAATKLPKNFLRLRREVPDIQPGCKFSTIMSPAELKVFSVWMTNDPHCKTAAWVLYKRPRAKREADRRLGPYIAVPIELCRFQR